MKQKNLIALAALFSVLLFMYAEVIASGAGETNQAEKKSKHAGRGITCNTCHGTSAADKYVANEKCSPCHGNYADLGKKTSIHTYMTVPHFGGGDNCGRCHREHGASESLCLQCHSEMENMKVP